MVSKYIIGALLLGAASAIELKEEHNGKFTWPIEGKVNAYEQKAHENKDAFTLDDALKSHYCTEKADHMCTMKSGDKHYLFCVEGDLGKHAIKNAEGKYDDPLEIKDGSTFKLIDTEVKSFESVDCKKQEKPLSEDEKDVLLAIQKGKLGEKDEKKAKDEKNTLCVSMTPKTKEADKKDDKKEKTEEPKKEVFYFQVEKAKDQKFTFELKNESLKALYENIICDTDEKVKEAAEKFLPKEESKCSGWWWLLVIPVVGGIGAGAYYALKEEDDEAAVDEYDAEYQA